MTCTLLGSHSGRARAAGTPHVCNPYEFFGLPNIWPRGYPLDQIKAPECNEFSRQAVRPLILQVQPVLAPCPACRPPRC